MILPALSVIIGTRKTPKSKFCEQLKQAKVLHSSEIRDFSFKTLQKFAIFLE